MAEEKWKQIAGFEGLYEVSNLGRIKRMPVPRYCGGGRYAQTKERVWHGYVDSQGYYSVNLGRAKKSTVHRLVCKAFHGPAPENMRYVAHFDGNKLNNCAANLRWASAKDNNGHDARRLGETCRGEKAWKSRLTECNIKNIRADYAAMKHVRGSVSEIARKYGISRSHASAIIRRALWRHI